MTDKQTDRRTICDDTQTDGQTVRRTDKLFGQLCIEIKATLESGNYITISDCGGKGNSCCSGIIDSPRKIFVFSYTMGISLSAPPYVIFFGGPPRAKIRGDPWMVRGPPIGGPREKIGGPLTILRPRPPPAKTHMETNYQQLRTKKFTISILTEN